MDIDTLIAEVGAQAIARFRRPLMDRAAAERLLDELSEALPAAPPPARPTPRSVVRSAAHPRLGAHLRRAAPRPADRPAPSSGPPPADDDPPPLTAQPAAIDDSADRSGRARELKAAARRVTGGQRPVRRVPPKQRDTLDHVTDPFLDQERAMGGERRRAPARSALLRPPSRPLPRVAITSAPPAPSPPESPTRAAMGALFEEGDSTEGLVFLGDEPDAGFERAGTDPTMAPLPGDDEAPPESIERTADNLDPPGRGTTVPDLRPQMPEIDPPTRGVTLSDHGRLDAPQLAGAEEPMPMDVPAAPFGFGPGDAEPTRTELTRPEQSPHEQSRYEQSHPEQGDPEQGRPRQSAERPAPERHAPAHLSEEVVVSSVRKLFRR